MTGKNWLCKWLVLLSVLVLTGACSKPVRTCPSESSEVQEGQIRSYQVAAKVDPTAGGKLKGEPKGDRAERMILLLDYSGSMYPGYGRGEIGGCERCKARVDSTGKPVRGKPGSEQPYYYETPEFRRLLEQWLGAAIPPGKSRKFEVLLYNGSVWQATGSGVKPLTASSQLTFSQSIARGAATELSTVLGAIPGNPSSVDARASLTTESRAALQKAVESLGTDGVIWLVTDNIVDTTGTGVSEADASRNVEFYTTLQEDPRIQMVMAYPVQESQACSWMCGTSLMVYGMYASPYERVSAETAHLLGGTRPGKDQASDDGLLWNTELEKAAAQHSGATGEAKVMAGLPLRLKPLDLEVVELSFVPQQGGLALLCSPSAKFGDKLRCVAEVDIRNSLRHSVISEASLSLKQEIFLPHKEGERNRLAWVSPVCAGEAKLLKWKLADQPASEGDKPIVVTNLRPLESRRVEVLFEVAPVDIGFRSVGQLLDQALTDKLFLTGRMTAEVKDIKTRLAVGEGQLAQVYGTKDLPSVFRIQRNLSAAAEYPVGAVVSNDGQVLAILFLGGVVILVLLVGFGLTLLQTCQYTVLINGMESEKLSLRRMSSASVKHQGKVLGRLRRGWGRELTFVANSNLRVRRESRGWVLTDSRGDLSEEVRLQVKYGWGKTAQWA